ncbi:ATP-NAD kinase family protein [Salinarchaeum chitinilyticum]
MRIGLVVNPVAGMGGRVGLKGTDGKVEEARERGAAPRAPDRAAEAMAAFAERAPDATVLAGPGAMGADAATAAGFEPELVGAVDPERTRDPATTTAADTRAVVADLADSDVDLVLFVGGDGTAVDVAAALDDVDGESDARDTPMLGVPAGVKVYSSVFAVTPREAGRIAAEFDRVENREINDIDEDVYREGSVETELRAVRPVPVAEGVQASKQLGGGSVEGLVEGFLADLQPGGIYVFGPGSTVGAIEDALGIDGSPLGVDVWQASPTFAEPPSTASPPDGELLVRDGSADEIRAATGAVDDDSAATDGDPAVVVVVSPIGGQGFLFGRGNQQIAPDVIRAAELAVVGSRRKLDGVGTLRVDTDDDSLDEELQGWRKVRVGRVEHRLLPVE